jgi:hypothetical protein
LDVEQTLEPIGAASTKLVLSKTVKTSHPSFDPARASSEINWKEKKYKQSRNGVIEVESRACLHKRE